jgi:hypothetical protein
LPRSRHGLAAVPLLLLTLCGAPVRAAAPEAPKDADTLAWWGLTAALSGDDMEGRDVGAQGYDRAADLVARTFRAAGLKPGAGESYFQTTPMQEAAVRKDDAQILVTPPGRPPHALVFLHEISVRAVEGLPARLDAGLAFRGYCGKKDVGPDVRGKVLVCFGGRRAAVPGAGERLAAAAAAGAVGIIAVDDPGFTIEPPRWPDAYARTVTLKDAPPPPAPQLAVMRLSDPAFGLLLEGSGRSAQAILEAGAASLPLESFDPPARFQAAFVVTKRSFVSKNVLGLLPGTDPALSHEVVVLSAHLDGYGLGEAVAGDPLYNGAFDDAAYVALLERLAQRRHGEGFRRPVLFAAFTGEEKGLLGAWWFVRHPTVPAKDLAADVNLDQIRPLFPLRILTMHAVDASTLGATAKGVAAGMGVEIRPDREPERRLLERADHWPFLKSGVPATGFVFGYDPGTEAERRYREWYRVRYHRPQDDMGQPIDFEAARDFNSFFYRFAAAVADGAERPAFLSSAPAF